jgi:hypothetical protein
MLVGEGFGLDGTAERTRLDCNLAAVAGFTASPATSNTYEMYQATPSPVDFLSASSAYQAEKLFGMRVTQQAGEVGTDNSSAAAGQARATQAYTKAGWRFIGCPVQVDSNGEPDYAPFVQKLQSCGVRILYDNLPPGPNLYGLLQAENLIGYHPIWIEEPDAYTSALAQWNTAGLGNNLYVRLSYEPMEAASVVPAVAKYLSILKRYGGTPSEFGEQATSSFLLWATAAKACGSTLTRQCVINKLSRVTSWTGGGLNAFDDPAKNLPSSCGLLMKLENTHWVQAYPHTLGAFDCSAHYVVPVPPSDQGISLNAKRYETEYVPASVLKPQA